MAFGYAGKILRVDLTSNEIIEENLQEELARKFIGARGINSKILYDEVKPGIDPFHPQNRLIFGAGPLAGTLLPAGCRFTVTARSPLTMGHGDANAGGFFASEMKFSGFDHIVFRGRAKNPSYLFINNGKPEVRDAGHLWGKNTWETQEEIKKELGDENIQIACIGPAGENMIKTSCIIHGLKRAAAKGMGSVMGSKNLKAVVVRGRKGISVAKPEEFIKIAKEIIEKHKRHDLTLYGTPGSILYEVKTGYSPATKNLQTTKFPGIEKISPEELNKKYIYRLKACFGCSISCGRSYIVREGEFEGTFGEGPELAAIWSWGTGPQVTSLPAILKADVLSNQLGIDCIEAGNTIAFAMECFQRGIITEEDTEGIKLEWGNYNAVHLLIEQMANKKGFGAILCDGQENAASRIGRGSGEFAHTIKGQSVPADLRVKHGSVLGYITSTRGADHLRGLIIDDVLPIEHIKKNYGEEALMSEGIKGKGMALKWTQEMTTLPDCFGVCKIFYILSAGYSVFTFNDFAKIYQAATGIKSSGEDIMKSCERVYNVEQAFNVRVGGFSRRSDRAPSMFFKKPTDGIKWAGKTLKKEDIERMLDDYYECRGWDKETTAPKKEKLLELELDDVAEGLYG